MNCDSHRYSSLSQQARLALTRRQLFGHGGSIAGAAALSSLLGPSPSAHAAQHSPSLPHFPPKVKNVIYLHMVGGPSQIDMFDYKPQMQERFDEDLPDSIRDGQRLTGMTSGQARFPVAPSKFQFSQAGECGLWMSTELLPYTAKSVDDIAFIRSMHTEAINHEPAITLIQTGSEIAGRACIGSWLSYGLGSENNNLPSFVVLVAEPSKGGGVQAISGKLWSSGFLPGEHAGVSFRSAGDPILYINNPDGVTPDMRRRQLDGLNDLNHIALAKVGDPDIETRIQQYEMAFRMQASVPDLTDLSTEPEHTFELYGETARKPGSFANTALMARRLTERGVRFVQIYHNGWDQHGDVGGKLPAQCLDIDQATHGLIEDLKQRGLFDETLIIWGGEFGRTIYSQGQLTKDNYGRDHHPRCFTMWLAGGGVKGGTILGETDDYSYNVVKDPVHIRDLQATVLHLLGIDHDRFTYRAQGLDFKLTGVEPAKVVQQVLS
jgi:uncharacterized protein (DUF1501 family)